MDINRIKEFRQFKKEIRESDRFLIVGLDIGKSMHYGFLGTASGKTVSEGLGRSCTTCIVIQETHPSGCYARCARTVFKFLLDFK